MIRLAIVENRIAALEDELAAEDLRIAKAIAAKQIGDGYWQRRHELRRQLRAMIELRDAVGEAQP